MKTALSILWMQKKGKTVGYVALHHSYLYGHTPMCFTLLLLISLRLNLMTSFTDCL